MVAGDPVAPGRRDDDEPPTPSAGHEGGPEDGPEDGPTRPRTAGLVALDGADLRRWAALVADRLEGARAELDALNVFPVPDGDTGTNLALTVGGAMAEPGGDLARALLVHARGNSGVIASQLVRGWADVLTVRGRGVGAAVTAPLVAKALLRGDELAWAAVTEPVEGTVLSVSRAAAEAGEVAAGTGASLLEVVDAVVAAAEQALDRTPLQLPALAAAGVVDAGGAGLVVALRALRDVVAGTAQVDATHGPAPLTRTSPAGMGVAGVDLDPAGPAYEVMYLLQAEEPGGVERLRGELQALGDSVVVVGGGGLWHVHVHTDDPGAAVEAGIDAGRPHTVRITHFRAAAEAQVGGERAEPAALAVVACAAGDATTALCRAAGAVVVPSAPGARASTGDVLAAVLEAGAGARRVVVLPNDAETAAVAHQAALAADEQGVTVVVARSRSQVQVLAALAVVGGGAPGGADASAALASLGSAVDGCRHGAVALAARQVTTAVGPCRVGDAVGTVGRDVVAVGPDRVAVAAQVLDHLCGDGSELVTLVPGVDGGPELAEALATRLTEAGDLRQVDVVGGGQPRYLLLLGCE